MRNNCVNSPSVRNKSKSTAWQCLTPLTQVLLLFVLLILIGVIGATPILDGDLFFHMAYAKQMLANKTLILDHTLFSWTPTNNNMIYCAWLGQLLFYGLWEKAGEWSVFALRYLCILGAFSFLFLYTQRLKLLRAPLIWLVLTLWVLASSGGYQTKPEIFSFLFFNILVYIYFHVKTQTGSNKNKGRLFYLIPALFVVWVNTHGGFIVALPFLIAIILGEGANLIFFRKNALSQHSYIHLITSFFLSLTTLAINPYGLRYPMQLWNDFVINKTIRPDIQWNNAYRSIFNVNAWNTYYIFYLVAMIFVLTILITKWVQQKNQGKSFDATIALLALLYIPLYCLYLRMTFYWSAVFAFSVVYMCNKIDLTKDQDTDEEIQYNWRYSKYTKTTALVALVVLIQGWACFEQIKLPGYGSWFGFGIGYGNPVQEAEFLIKAKIGPKIYNIFDSGGYLLWRLYPDYLVMTDSRSFPYLEWFDDQYRFSMGQSFDEFLLKYPADVAVIDLKNTSTWQNFLKSKDWRPVFYGPTAAIFVKNSKLLTMLQSDPKRFNSLKNADSAFRVFHFASASGDFKTAWLVLKTIEKKLKFQAKPKLLSAAQYYRQAHTALQNKEYETAYPLFHAALQVFKPADRDRLILTMLAAHQKLISWGKYDEAKQVELGLDRLAAPKESNIVGLNFITH